MLQNIPFTLLYTQVKSEDILFNFFVIPQTLAVPYCCVGHNPLLSSHPLLPCIYPPVMYHIVGCLASPSPVSWLGRRLQAEAFLK